MINLFDRRSVRKGVDRETTEQGPGRFFERLEDRLLLNAAYDLDIVARTGVPIVDPDPNGGGNTGLIVSLSPGPSINDEGKVAFIARDQPGIVGGRVIVDHNGVIERNFVITPLQVIDDHVQINNLDQVTWQDEILTNNDTFVRRLDSQEGGVSIGIGSDFFTDTPFDFVGPAPSINNLGRVIFSANLKTGGAVLATRDNGVDPPTTSVPVPPGGTPQFYPMIADNNSAVVKSPVNPAVLLLIEDETLASTVSLTGSPEFSVVGEKPGISDDGRVIAFFGVDTDGPGIFVNVDAGAGRANHRIAGLSGNGVLDPGETFDDVDMDGVFDPGEVDTGVFSGFIASPRVGVNLSGLGTPNTYTLAYAGIDLGGRIGLYTSHVVIDGSGVNVSPSLLVIEVGDEVKDRSDNELSGTVQDIGTFDPVNNVGHLAFWVQTDAGDQAVIKAQRSPGDFERLARQVAYRNWTKDVPVGVGDYTVNMVLEDPSGFYAVGLLSQIEGPAIVFRGTEMNMINDVFTDFDVEGVGYEQFQAAHALVTGWLDAQDERVDLVGHSLGGALAQWFAVDYTGAGKPIDQVVTFNAPGICNSDACGEGDRADRFRPELAGDVMHYITAGDVVSMAGEAFIEGRYTLASYADLDPFNKHLRPVIVESYENNKGDSVPRPNGIGFKAFDSVNGAFRLNSPIFMYRDLDYFTMLGVFQVVTQSVPALNPIRHVPSALLFRSTTEALRKDVGMFLDQLLDAAGPLDQSDPLTLEVTLPDIEIDEFFGVVDVKIEDMALRYTSGPPDSFRIQGRLSLSTTFNSDLAPAQAMVDFADPNYIEVREGRWDIKGVATVENIVIVPGRWELKEGKLSSDSVAQKLVISAKALLPFVGEVEGTIGFKEGKLDKVRLEKPDLDILIPKPPLKLRRIDGGVENLAKLNGQPPILFTGALGFTDRLPTLDIPAPDFLGGPYQGNLLNLDLSGDVDVNHFSGDLTLTTINSLATVTGKGTLDWRSGVFSVSGSTNALNGILTGNANFEADKELNVSANADVSFNLPDIFATPFDKIFNGQPVANGGYRFQFRNDSDASNDSLVAWGTIIGLKIGFQVNLNGSWRKLGAKDIEALTPSNLFESNQAAAASQAFVVDPFAPWAALGAGWTQPDAGTQIELITPDGTVLTEADIAANPDMSIPADGATATSKVVLILDPDPGQWTIRMTDVTGLGDVEFAAAGGTPRPSVAITSPLRDVSGPLVSIGYEAFDPDSDAQVSLYYDTDRDGFDGVLFAQGLPESDAAGSFLWDTTGVPAGNYYVYASIADGDSVPTLSGYSIGRVAVEEPAAPGPVRDVRARWGGGDQIHLTWTEAQDALYYLISYTDDAAGEFYTETIPTNGSTDRLTVSGLTPGETYRFKVEAVDGEGRISPASVPVVGVVGSTPTVPAGPGQWDVLAKPGTLYSAHVPINPGDVLSLEVAPEGATLDPAQGLFQWQVPGDETGWFEVVVVAERSDGRVDVIRRNLFAPPPVAVDAVLVNGSRWTAEFVTTVNGERGFAIPVGNGDQQRPVPWDNVDQIKIVFRRDVGTVDTTDVDLVGAASGDIGFTVSYDPIAFTATLTLSGFLERDALTLTMFDSVTDLDGKALDGEWDNPIAITDPASDTFPSGDGLAGGDFVFRFNVLPGDATGDGGVDAADLNALALNWQNQVTGNPADADFNGDGRVDAADLNTLALGWQLQVDTTFNASFTLADEHSALVTARRLTPVWTRINNPITHARFGATKSLQRPIDRSGPIGVIDRPTQAIAGREDQEARRQQIIKEERRPTYPSGGITVLVEPRAERVKPLPLRHRLSHLRPDHWTKWRLISIDTADGEVTDPISAVVEPLP